MPEILKIDANDDPAVLRSHWVRIKRILNLGGVIAYPTDTFYGLGVNPFNEQAVARIFKIKNRPEDKPLLLLVSSIHQVPRLVSEVSPTAATLIEKLWPGPTTLLLKSASHLPNNLTAHTGKIGIRQPGNDLTLKLIEGVGFPITGTSANISGADNTKSAQEALDCFGSSIDLIVDGGPAPEGERESTILDTTLSPPLIIREGVVGKSEIESILEMPCILVP